jgi:hypothetical protein
MSNATWAQVERYTGKATIMALLVGGIVVLGRRLYVA